MSKTLQFRFDVGGVLTDVDSVVLRDPDNLFGIRRKDNLAVIAAAGAVLTHDSTGLYHYTFAEPVVGLSYDYWMEYTYAGETQRIFQTLETSATPPVVAPVDPTYIQMGIDTVGCGDPILIAFLASQADLLWILQSRRGVTLDLLYQYYVSDLIQIAQDHVRMLIDSDFRSTNFSDTAAFDSTNTSSSSMNSTKARTSSFTESSRSNQNWVRTSSRSSTAASHLDSSNSASRDGASSDFSSISQNSSGSSSRNQSGSSTAKGGLAVDGTSGLATSSFVQSALSTTAYEGSGQLTASIDPALPVVPNMASSYKTTSVSVVGLLGASGMAGKGSVTHKVTPTVVGRINSDLSIDPLGDAGMRSSYSTSESQHSRTMVGSQTGIGSSTFSASGSRVNNRTGETDTAANSSTSGSSSSSMSSSSHEAQTRSASNVSHSESAYNASSNSSAVSHRSSIGSDRMTSVGTIDREYFSQIAESLAEMWKETQLMIRRLEKQVLFVDRYLTQKLVVVTVQASIIGASSAQLASTLIQRPGVSGTNVLGVTPAGSFDRFIVR